MVLSHDQIVKVLGRPVLPEKDDQSDPNQFLILTYEELLSLLGAQEASTALAAAVREKPRSSRINELIGQGRGSFIATGELERLTQSAYDRGYKECKSQEYAHLYGGRRDSVAYRRGWNDGFEAGYQEQPDTNKGRATYAEGWDAGAASAKVGGSSNSGFSDATSAYRSGFRGGYELQQKTGAALPVPEVCSLQDPEYVRGYQMGHKAGYGAYSSTFKPAVVKSVYDAGWNEGFEAGRQERQPPQMVGEGYEEYTGHARRSYENGLQTGYESAASSRRGKKPAVSCSFNEPYRQGYFDGFALREEELSNG